MGYDAHITRAEHWPDTSGVEIQAEEWLSIVRSDPDMIIAPEHGAYFAIWRGTVEEPEVWFDWHQGNVFTKNPDEPTLAKMIQLAERLDARVQGDDGDMYDRQNIVKQNNVWVYADTQTAASQEAQSSFWKRLLRRLR
ncbi:MAG TPA: hypothetical protein VD886_10135 [Herpetosiphonaceae bacterium]|nr:hypothetical protein [Herpetosiphonaceae bacterium]